MSARILVIAGTVLVIGSLPVLADQNTYRRETGELQQACQEGSRDACSRLGSLRSNSRDADRNGDRDRSDSRGRNGDRSRSSDRDGNSPDRYSDRDASRNDEHDRSRDAPRQDDSRIGSTLGDTVGGAVNRLLGNGTDQRGR